MTVEQHLESIDTRLERLVQATEGLRDTTESLRDTTESLRDTTESLRESSERQQWTVERLTGAFTEQARGISSLSQTVTRLVDSAQRSAQASEAAAIVAQNNQNTIRDLIEELRRGQ